MRISHAHRHTNCVYKPQSYVVQTVCNTLRPGYYNMGDNNFSAIMTWNFHGKYLPLTAMLICPVITIFYINFAGDYDLNMVDFWFSLTIFALSQFYTSPIPILHRHTFVERYLRNHYIKFGGKLTLAEPKHDTFSTPPKSSNWSWWPYCPWHHYWEIPVVRQLWLENQ